MKPNEIEADVKACYSTWSDNYYDSYYGANALYPPIHRDLLIRILREANVNNLLDAGCGPASFLREIVDTGIDLYGFDLTPEMVVEARRVLSDNGVPPEHIWEGSVTSLQSFQLPGSEEVGGFDAVICVGVLPHIPPEADTVVISNLRQAVKLGGLVILEARNQLFSLFTLNRYSHQFFLETLIRTDELKESAGDRSEKLDDALRKLEKQFRMDLPPVRKGKEDEPGYDEVLSRTHNPLVLKEQFATAGMKDIQLLFYHYHCLPPMLEAEMPDFFLTQSLAMEDPSDWRGYFMASAFLLAGRRA